MKSSELLETILAKPALYVGNRSIEKIVAYIDGYAHARIERGEYNPHDDLYRGFNQWVAGRLGIDTSHGWAEIISFMSGDEVAAFEMTKELWAEYKQEVSERGLQAANLPSE